MRNASTRSGTRRRISEAEITARAVRIGEITRRFHGDDGPCGRADPATVYQQLVRGCADGHDLDARLHAYEVSAAAGRLPPFAPRSTVFEVPRFLAVEPDKDLADELDLHLALEIDATESQVLRSEFRWDTATYSNYPPPTDPFLTDLVGRLDRYFSGDHNALVGVPLNLDGVSRFDALVYEIVTRIQPGEMQTYTSIAEEAGKPRAARAVGNALARNPMLVFMPCHRVVGRGYVPRDFPDPWPSGRRVLLALEAGTLVAHGSPASNGSPR